MSRISGRVHAAVVLRACGCATCRELADEVIRGAFAPPPEAAPPVAVASTPAPAPRRQRTPEIMFGRWRFADGRTVSVYGYDRGRMLCRDERLCELFTLLEAELDVVLDRARYLGR